MSLAFLAFALIAGLFTLNVFFPRRAGGWAALPSFFLGWLTGELALHHVAWQALIAAGFIALGALAHPAGAAALVVLGASWLGLLASVAQAHGARAILATALDQGLGTAWSSAPTSELTASLQRPLSRWRLVVPFLFGHSAVERIGDIAYADVGGGRNLLDVYRPRRKPTLAPVVLQIHGGAWVVGHKRQQALPLLVDLASRGVVCVSANYRLSPRATFPEHLIDVKRALIWIRKHIAEYGGDPSCVIVTGGSAGGHLAALLALTANAPEYQPGEPDVDTSVQGCIPFYGIYDLIGLSDERPRRGIVALWERQVLKRTLQDARESFEDASPIRHVRADAPPFFVIQGSHDSLVSVQGARSFAATLRAVSRAPVVYAELPGAQHAFDILHSLRTHHAIAGVRRFVAYVVERHRREHRP
jgi:acetyl esterase/lipase